MIVEQLKCKGGNARKAIEIYSGKLLKIAQ